MVQWFKDLGRSLDYLETRPDIDSDAFAFYGLSMGATTGSIHTALEHRFKASILLAGGLDTWIPKEVDQVSFLPRVRVPTLMLDGRHDYVCPLETSIEPMFSLLGTPEEDKRLVLFESGHIPPRLPVIKETLSWLDRYLGPVKRDFPVARTPTSHTVGAQTSDGSP